MKSTLALLLSVGSASAFVIPTRTFVLSKRFSAETEEAAIVSPFDDSQDVAAYKRTDPVELIDGPLDLTWENVEAVLDEMRPYLIQDGGNVAIKEIDGPVVRLELQVSHPLKRPTHKWYQLSQPRSNNRGNRERVEHVLHQLKP